jgi:hypothetical protein
VFDQVNVLGWVVRTKGMKVEQKVAVADCTKGFEGCRIRAMERVCIVGWTMRYGFEGLCSEGSTPKLEVCCALFRKLSQSVSTNSSEKEV